MDDSYLSRSSSPLSSPNPNSRTCLALTPPPPRPLLLLSAATAMADAVRLTPTTPLIAFFRSLQSAALASLGSSGFDPKVYVDFLLKRNLASTQAAFDALPSVDGAAAAATLLRYVDGYSGAAGPDLVVAQPEDFVAEPEGFLTKVERPEVRPWSLKVHALW